jgi:hypothetical protein
MCLISNEGAAGVEAFLPLRAAKQKHRPNCRSCGMGRCGGSEPVAASNHSLGRPRCAGRRLYPSSTAMTCWLDRPIKRQAFQARPRRPCREARPVDPCVDRRLRTFSCPASESTSACCLVRCRHSTTKREPCRIGVPSRCNIGRHEISAHHSDRLVAKISRAPAAG